MGSASSWPPGDLTPSMQQQQSGGGQAREEEELLPPFALLESILCPIAALPPRTAANAASSLSLFEEAASGNGSFDQFPHLGSIGFPPFAEGKEEFAQFSTIYGAQEAGLSQLAELELLGPKQEAALTQWSCSSPAISSEAPLSLHNHSATRSSSSSMVSLSTMHSLPCASDSLAPICGSSICLQDSHSSDSAEYRNSEAHHRDGSSHTVGLAILDSTTPSSTLINSDGEDCCSNESSKRRKATQSASGRTTSKAQMSQSQVRKLGERIAALQQLVSPFGKTDTASVLLEAIGYIKFLQDQVHALSSPYLASKSSRKDCEGGGDLRSRGLCLVPISCTSNVANSNGADYWISGISSCGRY